jgi:hypothetical protein
MLYTFEIDRRGGGHRPMMHSPSSTSFSQYQLYGSPGFYFVICLCRIATVLSADLESSFVSVRHPTPKMGIVLSVRTILLTADDC